MSGEGRSLGAQDVLHDEEWRAHTRNSPAFVSITDADDRIVFQNHTQPGVDDPIGTSIYDWIPPDSRELVTGVYQRARRTGFPQTYSLTAVGPNGATSHYNSWVARLTHADGSHGLCVMAYDVTHTRRMEDALAKSESTLQSIILNAPDYISAVDREHRLIFVNRPDADLDPLGQPVERFLPEHERSKVSQAIEVVFESGEPTSYETYLLIDDEERHFLTRLGAIKSGEQVERVILISTETTKEVLAQRAQEKAEAARKVLARQLEQAQKMEAIGQLTGGVAHDFNNLLTILLGNLDELAMDEKLSSRNQRLIERAIGAATRGAALTQRLLAFSRRQTLSPQVHHVGELIQGMRELVADALPETLSVKLELDPRPLKIEVDKAQLENAVINLVINARDAMPDSGTVVIATSTVRAGDAVHLEQGMADGCVCVSVTDDGAGMSPEVVAKIFEPFFTTKDLGAGSGLGLSMVYGFVSQSRGSVHVESKVDRGTKVSLVFPPALGDVVNEIPPSNAEEIPQGRGQRVLLVEDNAAMRELVAGQLKSLGYEVTVAEDGKKAADLLASDFVPDLVLSDYLLPSGINGLDVIRLAHARHPNVPSVLVSGYTDLHEEPGALASVGAPFLGKPFTIGQLARTLALAFE